MPELMPKVRDALDTNDLTYRVLECDPEFADTARFCEKYDFLPQQSANTILVASRKVEPIKYALCVVLATTRLDVNKKVCQLMQIKRASFADAETTRAVTGMEIGGVVAIGVPDLPVYVDSAVMQQPQVVMGGGNRTSKIVLDPQELKKISNVTIVEDLAKQSSHE